MRASTKRILSILVAFLLLFGALLVYGNLIQPEIGIVNDLRSQISSKDNLFNNQKAAVDKVQNFISQFQSISRLQDTVNLALPTDEGTTQAINQIQAVAQLSGININSLNVSLLALKPSEQSLVKSLGVLEVDLVLNGSYETIKSFFHSLETNARVSDVEEFEMRPADVTRYTNSYIVNVKVDMYYQSN